jgi:hypothetical protein
MFCYQNNIEAVVSGLKMTTSNVHNQLQFTLVLAGGNLTHENSLLRSLLQTKVNEAYSNQCQITLPLVPPEQAAALLAINVK